MGEHANREFPTALNLVSPSLISNWLMLSPEALLAQCKQSRYQGSGPGGQKRNRVYSGIRITHSQSGLSIEAEARREALGNLEDALHKLRMQIALLPTNINGGEFSLGKSEGSATSESASVFRIPIFRNQVSSSHFDFPIFVFRAIYFLTKFEGQISSAAQALGCTASALTRFLKIEKAVWSRAKQIREANGLHPLK